MPSWFPWKRKDDPMSGVRWIPAAETPFGMDVLDCRSFTGSMLSLTSDQDLAASFVALRGSDGSERHDQHPSDARSVVCDLIFPLKRAARDGPLFRAAEMEDKWDIDLHCGTLIFARSWTGDVCYRATIEFGTDRARLTCVEARGEEVEASPSYVVATVDYLIRSHLYNLGVPHPLPPGTEKASVSQLVHGSFNLFGRRAWFGTFGDPTRIPFPTRPSAPEEPGSLSG